MGISGFFYTWMSSEGLKTKNISFEGDVVYDAIPKRYKYRSLSLDLPGIIHDAAQKIWCYGSYEGCKRISNDDDKLMEAFLGEVTTRILTVVKLFHNLENQLEVLIIAIDGRAPVAKMNEQRSRRYIGRMNNPNPVFDSAKISPGTTFMHQIDMHLRKWIESKFDIENGPFPSQVIYSSFRTPGEGEHKIMEYYRSQQNTDGHQPPTDGHHVLYGIDNDLILLSLVSPINGILIMREEKEREFVPQSGYTVMGGTSDEKEKESFRKSKYENKKPVNRRKNAYSQKYINIDKFKELLNQLGVSVFDYMVLMNFVGNDFLPAQPSFEIKGDENVLNLISSYLDVKEEIINERKFLPKDNILIDKDHKIIWRNMSMLLEKFSKYEPKMISTNTEKMLNNRGQGFFGDAKVEPTDYRGFRNRWYSEKIFHQQKYELVTKGRGKSKTEELKATTENISPEDAISTIENMCLQYLKTFNWINQYYMTGIVDWESFYPYKYTPLLVDIKNNLKLIINTDNYSFIDNIYPDKRHLKGNYGIIEQLISIIPKESFEELLPEPLSFLPEAELKWMFPDYVEIDNHKARDYQVIVKLPNIDITDVHEVFEMIVDRIFRNGEDRDDHEEEYELARFYEDYISDNGEIDDVNFGTDNLWTLSDKDVVIPEQQKEIILSSLERIKLVYYEDPGIIWKLNDISFIKVRNSQIDIPWEKLTDGNRSEIIKIVSDKIRNGAISYPYSKFYMPNPKDLIHNKTEAKFVVYQKWDPKFKVQFFEEEKIDGKKYPKVILFKDSDYDKIDIITNWFTEDARVQGIFTTSDRKYRKNLLEGWKDSAEKIVALSYNYAINHRMNLNTRALNEGIYLSRIPSCTTFKISVAIVINNIFKSGITFDPFAGWGDRALGAMMSDTCYRYVGNDPNSRLWSGYEKIKRFVEENFEGKEVIFARTPIEDFLYESYFEKEEDRPDLIFSGPPYFDYEIYSDEETQSHIKHNTPEKWQQWLNENTKKAFEYLKDDCYLVYYLGNCGDIKIPKNLIEYMKQNVKNSEYKGVIPITKDDGRPLFCYVWKKI